MKISSDDQSFTEEFIKELANLSGITIAVDELTEVTNRYSSLILELDKLKELDLSNIQPIVIFPENGTI